MIESNLNSHLDNFIQLIQLWAGICLLFFYQPLLEKSPSIEKLKSLDKCFKDFVTKHQFLLFDKPKHEFVYDPTRWNNFVPRIKNMAAITFFYCVFLLLYIGIQKSSNFYPVNHPSFLLITNLLILFYLFFCCTCDFKIFKSYSTPALYIFAILLFFVLFEALDKLFDLIKQSINVNLHKDNLWLVLSFFTLFVCIIGMLLILFRIWMDGRTIKKKLIKLHKLDNKFNIYECCANDILKHNDYSMFNESDKGIMASFCTINDDVIQDNRIEIINKLSEIKDQTESQLFDSVLNQLIFDLHMNKPNCELTTAELMIIRPLYIEMAYNNINKRSLIEKIISEMTNDYYKEKFEKGFYAIEIKDNQEEPEEKTEEKTEEEPEEKTEEKSEEKSEEKTEEKTEEKSVKRVISESQEPIEYPKKKNNQLTKAVVFAFIISLLVGLIEGKGRRGRWRI